MDTQLNTPSNEDELWNLILEYQNHTLWTCSHLEFSYTVKIGKDGNYNKELLIDRKQNSKTLTWSSIWLAYKNALAMKGQVIEHK